MKQTELYLFDFDGTLYDSPRDSLDPTWYFHAQSFGEPKAPGFDPRWSLGTVIKARRAMSDPSALTVVLTGRPQHAQMRTTIQRMLAMADLHPNLLQLKPVEFQGTTPQYKAIFTGQMLEKHPSIKRVTLVDDEVPNHVAVGAVVTQMGKVFRSLAG